MSTNWIKPLYKGEDVMNVSNDWTIMVDSLTTKFFRCIMNWKMSARVKKIGKRTYEQASFWKHHDIIDHLLTLRVLIGESCLSGDDC